MSFQGRASRLKDVETSGTSETSWNCWGLGVALHSLTSLELFPSAFFLHQDCQTSLKGTDFQKSKSRICQDPCDFPDGSDSKESTWSGGDSGLIPGSERSPGEGNGNSLQYPCLENSMDRWAWWATVYRVTKNLKWLSDQHFHYSKLYSLWCPVWPQSCANKTLINQSLMTKTAVIDNIVNVLKLLL